MIAATANDPLMGSESPFPAVPSNGTFSINSESNHFLPPQLASGLKTVLNDYVKPGTSNLLWYFSIVCSLIVIGVYGSFAKRRANSDSLFQEIIYPLSSVLFNVGALFFLKRVKKLSLDFQSRYDDPFYKGIFVFGLVLGLMTVAASVEISESSVADWGAFGNFAVFCFSLNNFITRLLGTVDCGDRAKRRIEFRDVYSILNEFMLKKEKIDFDAIELLKNSDATRQEIVEAIVKEMSTVKTPMGPWIAGWAKWFFLQVVPAVSSVTLISMWIAITQSGFNRLDAHWSAWGAFTFLANYPTTTGVIGFPNMAFYALNIFDTANAMIDFHVKLTRQFAIKHAETLFQHVLSMMVHTMLLMSVAVFTGLAYFSGGGFGATVLGLNENGYGTVVSNSMLLSSITNILRPIYVQLAQSCAGGVNENSTARLITGFVDHRKKHPTETVAASLLNYMDLKSIYDFCVRVSNCAHRLCAPAMETHESSNIQDSSVGFIRREEIQSSEVPVLMTSKERAVQVMREMKSKIVESKFVEKTVGDRRTSYRDMLQYGEDEAPIHTSAIVSLWKSCKENPVSESVQTSYQPPQLS